MTAQLEKLGTVAASPATAHLAGSGSGQNGLILHYLCLVDSESRDKWAGGAPNQAISIDER